MNTLYNADEVKKAISVLCKAGELFEIRILGNRTLSGYFTSADTLIQQFGKVDLRNANVYITLQAVKNECYNRSQRDHFIQKPKTSTSDDDIQGYKWFFVDIDPERIADTSSTDEQLRKAFATAKRVAGYLDSIGFTKPIKAGSGNGAHLLYRISMKNTEENKRLVEKGLQALSILFSDNDVKIDTVNYNPSRICKLYGTLAQKGSDTETNPHRMSRIFAVPDEIMVTPKEILQKLADVVPEEQPKQTYNNHTAQQPFDMESKLREWGLHFKKSAWKDGVRYVFDKCPFNSEHTGSCAAAFKMADGSLGFTCQHNSCADKHWKDLRMLFEPEAYDRAEQIEYDIRLGWEKHNRNKQAEELPGPQLDEIDPNKPVWCDVDYVLSLPKINKEYIQTGISMIDEQMQGLAKGALTVLSGLRGAGKSTVLGQIILHAVDKGHRVLCYSGELSMRNFFEWIFLQAAGPDHVQRVSKYAQQYEVVDPDIRNKIKNWLGDKLDVFNHERYSNNFQRLHSELEKKIQTDKTDLVIIDNLMSLNLSSKVDKNEAQTEFVWKLKRLAISYNVHVIFVAHPRKSLGFLRLDDIAGTGNLANVVDNALIIHRANIDFFKSAATYYGKDLYRLIPEPTQQDSYGNVLEVCKNREFGIQDTFIPLWFDPKTKRMNNNIKERMVFGWKVPDKALFETDDDEPY